MFPEIKLKSSWFGILLRLFAAASAFGKFQNSGVQAAVQAIYHTRQSIRCEIYRSMQSTLAVESLDHSLKYF